MSGTYETLPCPSIWRRQAFFLIFFNFIFRPTKKIASWETVLTTHLTRRPVLDPCITCQLVLLLKTTNIAKFNVFPERFITMVTQRSVTVYMCESIRQLICFWKCDHLRCRWVELREHVGSIRRTTSTLETDLDHTNTKHTNIELTSKTGLWLNKSSDFLMAIMTCWLITSTWW